MKPLSAPATALVVRPTSPINNKPPESATKPKGTYAAYIIAAHWLGKEFAKKLIMVQLWEDMKLLINHYPAPSDFSECVVGIEEENKESAVTAANEKRWGVLLHGQEFTVCDVVCIGKETITAFLSTINERKNEHLEFLKRRMPRKRARLPDVGAGGGQFLVLGDDGDDDDADAAKRCEAKRSEAQRQ